MEGNTILRHWGIRTVVTFKITPIPLSCKHWWTRKRIQLLFDSIRRKIRLDIIVFQKEVPMRMRHTLVIVLIFLVVGTVAMAATPSIFEVGLVNSYAIQDLVDTNFASYSPSIRMAFYINEWFGLSTDVLLQDPFDSPSDLYAFYIATDLVFRWPLGFFEPYVALGPAYRIELINGDPALPEVIPYGARVGFDFNITPVLALGIEGKHLIPNLPDLVGTSATGFDLTGDTHVGLVVKAKL